MDDMPLVNEKKSRQAAERVLSKYRTQRSYAMAPVDPRITANWDGLPHSTAIIPQYSQARLERQQSGEKFCKWCDECIKSMANQDHQRLLRMRYCEGYNNAHPDSTAIELLDISQSTYTRRKRDALLAAAYCFGVETT